MRIGDVKLCKCCGRAFTMQHASQRYCGEQCRLEGKRANCRASFHRHYQSKRELYAARNGEIVRKYQNGRSISALAKEYFFTSQNIRYILKKEGVLR